MSNKIKMDEHKPTVTNKNKNSSKDYNRQSTKDFTSLNSRDNEYITLTQIALNSNIQRLPPRSSSPRHRHRNVQTITFKRLPLKLLTPPLSTNPAQRYTNQALSNTFILLSVPLMIAAYSFSNFYTINPNQTMFYKFLIQVILQFGLSIWRKKRIEMLRTRHYKGLVKRGIMAALLGLVQISILLFLPIFTVFTLTCSGVVFSFLFTINKNKTIMNSTQQKAVIFCGLGILITIIAQTYFSLFVPTYQFHSIFPYVSLLPLAKLTACLLVVLFMVAWGYSLLLWGNSPINSDYNQTIFIHSIVGLFIFSLAYLGSGIQGNSKKIAFISGLMLAISYYFFQWGLKFSINKRLTGLLNQVSVPISYAVSMIFFQQNPNWFSFFGSIFMLTGVSLLLKQGSS